MRKLIAVGTVLALLGAGGIVFLQLGKWLSSSDAGEPVDVIVVPGGDPDRRLDKALDHVDAGLAARVWVTVGPSGPVVRERDAIDAYAARRGHAGLVEVLGESTSTRQDAELAAGRLGTLEHSGRRPVVAVVSSPYHLARVRITFDRFLAERAEVLAWPDDSAYDATEWWRTDPETTAIEAVKVAGALALYGARPTQPFQAVPLGLPARALAGGFVVALVAGAFVRPFARRLGLVARPRLFRAHATIVPLLGGAAILAGLAGGVLAGGGFAIGPAGAVAAAGVAVLAAVGLADDVAGLGARSRLVWAAAAGTAAWLLGFRTVVVDGGATADVVNAIVTILWFVGVTHAMNLLDNLDGAAAGVGLASALGIAAVAATSGQWVVAVAAASLAGALGGYLVHNVHPARLFMGDLGALGTGFALASLALALRPAQHPPVSFSIAVLVVAVPLFDAVLVTISRVRERRQVALGGTDHTAHRLIARGWPVRRAAAALWAAQIVCSLAALAVAGASAAMAWTIAVIAGLAGLGALALFLRMPAWRPPGRHEAEHGTLVALERALGPLGAFVREAKGNGLASADPQTVRGAEEILNRLERTRGALRHKS